MRIEVIDLKTDLPEAEKFAARAREVLRESEEKMILSRRTMLAAAGDPVVYPTAMHQYEAAVEECLLMRHAHRTAERCLADAREDAGKEAVKKARWR